MALTGLIVKAIGLGAIFVLTQYVLTYLRSPLKQIPGPFLAKFSNIWRFLNHYGQTHIETQKKLHEKYGDVVRLGPKTVSLADTSLIKTIYNARGTFVKVRLVPWQRRRLANIYSERLLRKLTSVTTIGNPC
jgi:hypothetical protein